MASLNHDNFDRAPAPVPTRPTVQAANRDALSERCDLARAVETFRGRWKPSIVMALQPGPRTLPDLHASLAEPARRVLIRALRELQADAIVTRHAEDGQPTYALTADGRQLTALFQALAAWSRARDGLPGVGHAAVT